MQEIHAELTRVGGSLERRPRNTGDWWKAYWEFDQDQALDDQVAYEIGEWRHPIAGMHVRRTDHGHEAPFRQVDEYMSHIENWWSRYRSHPDNQRNSSPASIFLLLAVTAYQPDLQPSDLRIYLATDEPQVIKEASDNYPHYGTLTFAFRKRLTLTWLGSTTVFLTTTNQGRASGEGERVGMTHTLNLLSDIFHLAICDFFVGTASSQVSRYFLCCTLSFCSC